MFPILNTTLNIIKRIPSSVNIIKSNFHVLNTIIPNNTPQLSLLRASTPSIVPNCGFKVKGRLRKRCKDCYFVWRQERLFVICETHPRHKQMSMIKDPKNTWMLSHATQSKVRPW